MTLLLPPLLGADASDATLGALWSAETIAPTIRAVGVPAPTKWATWLTSLFPNHVRAGFALRHTIFWRHVWAIRPESAPDPFVGLWPRGGAKTSSMELGATAMGARGTRKYALYVRGTQDRADDSVSNIAALFESDGIARHYPDHARRRLGKHGNSKGWRRNRVWTDGGFVIDAIGLDVAARGVKLEDQRPDLLIFDDLDEKHDTPATTAKKIQTITTSLLPAGATNAAVFGLQNLIIPDGIFGQLADGRADFLARRVVSGPHPAVEGLETEAREDARTGLTRHVIVGGTATWQGQDLATCQRQIDEWGIEAFRKESQHDVALRGEGLAVPVTDEDALDLSDAQVRTLVSYGQAFAGIDFGHWRFAFLFFVADAAGRAICAHEYFNQRGDATERARGIHAIAKHYGVLDGLDAGQVFPIWGDAANPSDIAELNAAFRRMGSPLVVVAVGMANKQRQAAVERMNDARGRGALKYRATLGTDLTGAPQRWFIGMNAGSAGVETRGSRLRWEHTQWRYPVPKPGEPQEQNPDDETADGADAIAAERYALMSWWTAGTPPATPARTSEHQHPGRTPTRPAFERAREGVRRTSAPEPRALRRLPPNFAGGTVPAGFREVD